MMSRARKSSQHRDSAASSCREGILAPATDHHGPRSWTWLETVSLRRCLGRPVRIAVNLAGAAGAALFAQASLQFYLRTHSLIGGAFLVEQTWFAIAFLIRRPPSAVSRNPGSWREHVARAQQQLRNFIGDLLAEGAKSGDLRDDVAPGELASYCIHALTAASGLPSKAAVRRLVTVTMAGLRPPHLAARDAAGAAGTPAAS
jgi:hypothetical protein